MSAAPSPAHPRVTTVSKTPSRTHNLYPEKPLMSFSLKKSLLPILGALALAVTSSAQCPQPDSLDGGPCCGRAKITLPKFPGFKQDSLSLCWLDCDVEKQAKVTVKWSPPTTGSMMPSNDYTSILRMRDSAGNMIWRGRLRLTYSRTWEERDPVNSTRYQVWRFLVNGDLRHTSAAGAPPCPVPSCASAHQRRVRQTGYVDWALDCSTQKWSNSWMLTHACDKFEHIGGFPRGGGFHPERSFSFVGPAAGFVVSAMTPIENGTDNIEVVRRLVRPTLPLLAPITVSQFEEVVTFQVTPQQQPLCPCSPVGKTGQFAIADLLINGVCGTNVVSSGQWLPGFVSMGIGVWTDPSVYPGTEIVRWNMGEYNYFEPCTQTTRLEIFHGVTTFRGYEAHSLLSSGPSVLLPLTFIDQSNALRAGATTNNIPFISDHVLNLNHW